MGEKQRLLQSTKDSQYFDRFSFRIVSWEQRLNDLSWALEHLNSIQRKWIYLEPICTHNVIPKDESRFRRTDADFRVLMRDVAKEPKLVLWLKPTLKQSLPLISEQLQRTQKALTEFLEEKRMSFPRFYFIGDEDLLEILGQSANPKVIQSHLKKLFAGIQSVAFSDDLKSITAVHSPEGEVIELKSRVNISGSVEVCPETSTKTGSMYTSGLLRFGFLSYLRK